MNSDEEIQSIGKRTDRGHNMTLYSGQIFFPLDPKPEDMNLLDIAHALSNMCRFNGHTIRFYSVAQHSVIVSQNVERKYALQALMHDAAEAYCGDIISPLKVELSEYRIILKRIEKVVGERFGFDHMLHQSVKEADCRAALTEKRDLLMPSVADWSGFGDLKPFDEKIEPLLPKEAEQLFLDRFAQVNNIW